MRQSVFEILDIEGTHDLAAVRKAYRDAIRKLTEKLGYTGAERDPLMQQLNDAYGDVKTQEKLDDYIRANPWAMTKRQVSFPFYAGEKLNDRGLTETGLYYVTPRDRQRMREKK